MGIVKFVIYNIATIYVIFHFSGYNLVQFGQIFLDISTRVNNKIEATLILLIRTVVKMKLTMLSSNYRKKISMINFTTNVR